MDGGIYLYEDRYNNMTLPIYRRLMDKQEMKRALQKANLKLEHYEQKLSLQVFICHPK